MLVLVVGSCGELWIVGGSRGNSSWACVKASLMSFGVAINFCLNSLGDNIWRVSGFWI